MYHGTKATERLVKRMCKELTSGSYSKEDVVFLLKEISSCIREKDNNFRENAIQSGVHYSEMLPIEYHPTEEYMKIFHETLEASKKKIADLVGVVSDKILKQRGKNLVLVSLARAGTPIGILIKRYIKFKYNLNLPHYSISIIRDKGLDENAVNYILQEHPNLELQFIDGWTGKGVIQDTLIKSCSEFEAKYGKRLNSELAVLADPAYCANIYGTREDFLIPSACLNATVSGLMSRTVHNERLILKDDFHGAKYYKEWIDIDVSNFFIDKITEEFTLDDAIKGYDDTEGETKTTKEILKEIDKIKHNFKIDNSNLIKPGVGETTRVLLRRIPWKILIDSFDNPNLRHILKLAKDRNVPVEVYKDMTYSCCGIIKPKTLSDI